MTGDVFVLDKIQKKLAQKGILYKIDHHLRGTVGER